MEKEENSTSPRGRGRWLIKPTPDPSIFPWRVAAIVLLFVTCGLLFFFNRQATEQQSDVEAQQLTIFRLQRELRDLKIDLDRGKAQLRIVTQPNFKRYILESADLDPDIYALLYWDQGTGEVYFDPSGLPALGVGQQYQLWAFFRGNISDLGTVLTGDIGFQEMEKVERATRFFVTLEPAGGRTDPSMNNLIASFDL